FYLHNQNCTAKVPENKHRTGCPYMEHTPYHTLELRQPRKCYSQCLVHFIHAANPEGQAQTDLKIQFTTDTDVHVLPLATSTDTAAAIITRWKPFQDDLVLTNNLHARTLVLRD